MKEKTEILLTQFWVIIYIIREFNFCKNLRIQFFFKKIRNISLTQFWAIIYIISEFNFMNKTNTLLVQFWVIIYITSEFNFCQNLRI